MKRPQFSLRTALLVMVIIALMAGWWADRRRLAKTTEELTAVKAELFKEQALFSEQFDDKAPNYKLKFTPTPSLKTAPSNSP